MNPQVSGSLGGLAGAVGGPKFAYNDEVRCDRVVTSTYLPGAAFALCRPWAGAVHRPSERLGAGRGGPAGDQAQSDAAPRGPGWMTRGRVVFAG
jgi:hypothetical protein